MASSNLSETIHGVLVSVRSVGILLLGEAGTGKSECALKLLARNHQLVADDVVELDCQNGKLTGKSPPNMRGLLASRIFGILDIQAIFGAGALIDSSEIDLFVEFTKETADVLREPGAITRDFLGISVPGYSITANQAAEAANLIELAAHVFRAPDCVISAEEAISFGLVAK